MNNDPEKHRDLTGESSERDDEQSTSLARQMESDDQAEFTGAGLLPTPDGDSAGENKVATSLDNE